MGEVPLYQGACCNHPIWCEDASACSLPALALANAPTHSPNAVSIACRYLTIPPGHHPPNVAIACTPRTTEAGSYLRLIDSCITQLKAQGPFRTCNESKEEETAARRVPQQAPRHHPPTRQRRLPTRQHCLHAFPRMARMLRRIDLCITQL